MTIQLAQLRLSLSASALALLCFGTGCDVKQEEIGNDPPGSANSGSATGTGGTGGSGGAGTAGSSSAEGGAGTGGTGAGGPTCHGDAGTWTEITQGPIACTKNSDCCVVLNGCLSEAQIVHASNADVAKTAWPYCDSQCNDCIPPDVTVFCFENQCVGISGGPGENPMDHCGVDEEPGTGGGPTGEHFDCGG